MKILLSSSSLGMAAGMKVWGPLVVVPSASPPPGPSYKECPAEDIRVESIHVKKPKARRFKMPFAPLQQC